MLKNKDPIEHSWELLLYIQEYGGIIITPMPSTNILVELQK